MTRRRARGAPARRSLSCAQRSAAWGWAIRRSSPAASVSNVASTAIDVLTLPTPTPTPPAPPAAFVLSPATLLYTRPTSPVAVAAGSRVGDRRRPIGSARQWRRGVRPCLRWRALPRAAFRRSLRLCSGIVAQRLDGDRRRWVQLRYHSLTRRRWTSTTAATNTFAAGTALGLARGSFAAATVGNLTIFAGGLVGSSSQTYVDMFDWRTGTPTAGKPLFGGAVFPGGGVGRAATRCSPAAW